MLSNSEQSICVLISTPPNADLEASELALALAAFDLPVQVVFIDAGLWWLLEQSARKLQGKSATKVLSAFPLYGIEQVFYYVENLASLGIDPSKFTALAQALDHNGLLEKISHSQHCFTF